MVILEKAGWRQFFEKIIGHIEYMTTTFSRTFDGKCAQVGNLTIHLFENSLSRMLEISQIGENGLRIKALTLNLGPHSSSEIGKNPIGLQWY